MDSSMNIEKCQYLKPVEYRGDPEQKRQYPMALPCLVERMDTSFWNI